ncbi:unnamed protein product [Linum tenue]|uniref:WRKY domain-containing protein n=1 Tax=Linum tenue TaxID=586396 RepID=A0AAV0L2S6_9ROSI|nr:unnamed protein product [Linum tenue]
MNFFNPNPNYSPPPPSFPQFADPAAVQEFHFSDYLLPEGGDHDDYNSNYYMDDYSPDPHHTFADTTTTATTSPVQIGSGGGGSWNSVGNDDGDYHESRRNYGNGKQKIISKGSESRVAFRTKSELEVMDDGFKWRKYGKKSVKNTPNPRHYYKCSSVECGVKKRVEKDREDSRYVITTYDGVHTHESPSSIQQHAYYTKTQTKPYPSSSSSPSST